VYRYGEEEVEAAVKVIRSGQWFRYGDPKEGHLGEAQTFEREWAAEVGADHACFTTNGTAALMCCLAGLGIGPGDEVIVPGYTWVATALAVLHVGAIPVLVDVDETLTLDPEAAERAITPRTKAICPVHMNGFMADMDRLEDLADRHGLMILEDSCQADGGLWYDGRHAGTIGDAGAYSFNRYKVIACGDGGMLVAKDQAVFERALIYHDGGIGFRAHADRLSADIFAGVNLRGNEILAAIMRVQLSRLSGIVGDLIRNRERVLAGISSSVEVAPVNGGWRTGTGSTLALRFPDEPAARRFSERFNALGRAVSEVVIDSGRHVYSNWTALMDERGGHTPAADPFQWPANASHPRYGPAMLPRTLEILRTTAVIGVNPDWTEEECDAVAKAVTEAHAQAEAHQDR
jgi:dTDP-4-amino-4,6-dideoxygalactose transaminase